MFLRDNSPISKARVRVPMRAKITIPYALLAIVISLAAAYLVSQLLLQTVQDRFNNQLVKVGKQGAAWMVTEENRLLETLRLVAGTAPVSASAQAKDAESLHNLILPLAINGRIDAVEILDLQGTSILSLRHQAGGNPEDYIAARGEQGFEQSDFIQAVIEQRVDPGGDKFAGVRGDYFYVSGPLHDAGGHLVGVVLVGETQSLLAHRMDQETMSDVSFYDLKGQPLASTLFSPPDSYFPLNSEQVHQVMANQDKSSLRRDLVVNAINYSEILAPWEARSGQDLGFLGVSLAQTFLARTNQISQIQIYILVVSALLLVILVGLIIANQITRPLLRVVAASAQVARGDLSVKVKPGGNDEVAILGLSFNKMVEDLQEGSIYRDLLGRTVSPEVREQLRQAFGSGDLNLKGQSAVATVLMTDIRDFTSISEKVDPATVFTWLNEYYGALAPIIAANGGVINKFDGDAMLAFFGILPRLLEPGQGAYGACLAAVNMLKILEQINIERVKRGDLPLATGMGINTGTVTAGSLGTTDRLHYTIIGDTVNTTQRLEALTRQLLDGSGVLVGQATYDALGERRAEFHFEPMGPYTVRGKEEQIEVFRLLAGNGPGSTATEAIK